MSIKEVIQLLKAMPKRMILVIVIIIAILVALIDDIGIKSFIALLALAFIGYIIAKITYRDY